MKKEACREFSNIEVLMAKNDLKKDQTPVSDVERCPSCQTVFLDRFCHGCGEKKLFRQEMTLRYFFGAVWNALTFTDVKFIRSVSALLFQPGLLTLEYWKGRRKLYTPPLALFFFINLVYFLYQPVDALNSSYRSQITGQTYSAWADKTGEAQRVRTGLTSRAFELKYNRMTSQISKLGLVVFILIYAFGMAAVNIGSDRLFYHHIIASTHYVSFAILGLLILFPLLARQVAILYAHLSGQSLNYNVNAWYFTLPITLILGVYAFGMQKRLYDRGIFIILAQSLLLVLAFALAVIAYRFFLFVVTLCFV